MEFHWYVTVVAFILQGTFALYENCDMYQEMELGREYFVYSPGYSNKYYPGTSCRWYAVSPPGTQIFLMCETFSLPPSQNCYYDRLSVSTNGNVDLTDATNYCGNGSFSVISTENRMNIALITSSNSPGGSFLCSIGVQKTSQPPENPNPQCDCGWASGVRIVNGAETGINEFPMMAGIIDGIERELFCGATIISHRYAVTAAHCMHKKNAYEIGLLVGDHDITLGNETDSARLYLIDLIKVHSQYNSVTHENDIALVRTDQDIEFGRQVGPVCLPFKNVHDTFAGERVEIPGWGTTEFGGPTSNTLQKVSVNVLTQQQCQATYGELVTPSQICTYAHKKDACQSDSGGPLLWRDFQTQRLKLVGLVSYGIKCATDHPSVNTRLTSYLDWIQRTTGEDYCWK